MTSHHLRNYVFVVLIAVLPLSHVNARPHGDGALVIDHHDSKVPKCNVSEKDAGRIYRFVGFTPEFEELLSAHPQALAAGRRANAYKTVATVGGFTAVAGLLVILYQVLQLAIDSDREDEISISPVVPWLVLGGWGIQFISSNMAESQLRKTVDIFNEHERKNPTLSFRHSLQNAKLANQKKQVGVSFVLQKPIESGLLVNSTHRKAVVANFLYQF